MTSTFGSAWADLRLAPEDPTGAMDRNSTRPRLSPPPSSRPRPCSKRQIKAYQSTGTLVARISSLQQDMKTTPTAAGWTRLARLLEAEGKPPEAAAAIGEATRIDPKSVPAWVTMARLREAAGDILGSVDALRMLTTIDRRSRTDYLTGIAKLEARLGRRGPALEAGRELLAAAPGNPDNHQFLRRNSASASTNPTRGSTPSAGPPGLTRPTPRRCSPWPRTCLASSAPRKRSNCSGEPSPGRLRLTASSPSSPDWPINTCRGNQLDRLIGRLERELREPNQQRELSLCLAQAHAASGDYATARLELERLLSTNARDGHLLVQLSNLAEQEGDISSAAKYQKQALDIAPNAEASGRLASLYLKAGEVNEAEGVWSRLATENQEPTRVHGCRR